MIHRQTLLERLIRCEGSLSQVKALLYESGWDADRPVALLKRCDLISALQQYLDHSRTATDIEEWADALEGREDIDYETGFRELIVSTLFHLANPALTSPLDRGKAIRLIQQLR